MEEVEQEITLPSCSWRVEFLTAAAQETLLEKEAISSDLGPGEFPALPVCVQVSGVPRSTDHLYFLSVQWLGCKTPSFKGPGNMYTHSHVPFGRLRVCPAPSQKNCCTEHTQRLKFIIMLSKKLEPGYQPSALDSVS